MFFFFFLMLINHDLRGSICSMGSFRIRCPTFARKSLFVMAHSQDVKNFMSRFNFGFYASQL